MCKIASRGCFPTLLPPKKQFYLVFALPTSPQISSFPPPPAAIHIVAHLFNFEYFMDAQLSQNSSYLPSILSEFGTGDNASFLNPIRTNETVKFFNVVLPSSHGAKVVQPELLKWRPLASSHKHPL